MRRVSAVSTAFVSCGAGNSPDCPLKSLFDFTRVKGLQPGASETVSFSLSPEALSCVDSLTGSRVLWPGEYSVSIGDVVTPAVQTIRLTAGQRGPSSVNWHPEGGVIVATNDWVKML